jgi:hypothetical protein
LDATEVEVAVVVVVGIGLEQKIGWIRSEWSLSLR